MRSFGPNLLLPNTRRKEDAIKKLLTTVVALSDHVSSSHEYKQSLSVPFNYALQTGWGQGLAEARSEEELREIMMRMNWFDAYSFREVGARSPKTSSCPSSKGCSQGWF
ncbi:hypothetical protein Tco_1079385 [Tanacetum coccineum]|uniref:Uncharacterized protein n=1 Tax=Tanacetum coccineum TaxID=301880 RepID=A0ABQ5HT87_9ASTR